MFISFLAVPVLLAWSTKQAHLYQFHCEYSRFKGVADSDLPYRKLVIVNKFLSNYLFFTFLFGSNYGQISSGQLVKFRQLYNWVNKVCSLMSLLLKMCGALMKSSNVSNLTLINWQLLNLIFDSTLFVWNLFKIIFFNNS